MTKKNAADVMLRVLEDWDIKTIYGLPGGSFDSTMNALYNRQDTIRYVQVRHEEVGALAAAGEAKVTRKIAACFGSAGPGAVHLLNGLYDAKHDHVPVLALVGQVPTDVMNTDYFQELNENPIFADVAVYNRTVMTAEQLPHVVDEAIRQAYKNKGPAVVTLPKDLGWAEIEDDFISSAELHLDPIWPEPALEQVDKAVKILREADYPILYFGIGAKHAKEEILALSEKLSLPIVSTALAKGIIPDDYPAYMQSVGRVATKPGVELSEKADAILFVGSNYPFGESFFRPDAKFIQVDVDSSRIGSRYHVDVPILADAKKTLHALIERSGEPIAPTPFYQAALENKKNWDNWVSAFKQSESEPLRVEPVFDQINQLAKKDAIFQVDVGNVTIEGVRFLRMNQQESFTTSAWYATMGYALPAAIGAQAHYPDRQVWSISGDGGWAMVSPDILTQVKYKMPIINVVLSNQSLAFIEGEQDDRHQPHSGVDLLDGDWGENARSLGAEGYTVRTLAELKTAFQKAGNAKGPVVIDVKITNDRPLPVEQLVIDDQVHDPAEVKAFVEKYQAQGLIPFRQLLENSSN